MVLALILIGIAYATGYFHHWFKSRPMRQILRAYQYHKKQIAPLEEAITTRRRW